MHNIDPTRYDGQGSEFSNLMNHFNSTIPGTRINIERMYIQESGSYGEQYLRPYSYNGSIDQIDNLARRVNEIRRSNPLAPITGGLVAGATQSLLEVNSNWERPIQIPTGWDTRRFRFMMRVEIPKKFGMEIYLVQGYSEYAETSYTGRIDDNLVFFINSMIRLNQTVTQDHNGMRQVNEVVVENVHVIDGRYVSDQTSHASRAVYTMRPLDIFNGIQTNYYTSTQSAYDNHQTVDFSTDHSTDTITSRRNNQLPSGYIGRLLENYQVAKTYESYGQGTENVHSRALQSSYEPQAMENPFVSAISNLQGLPCVTHFTLGILRRLDPSLTGDRVIHMQLDQTIRLTEPGDSVDWKDVGIYTHIAAKISSAISGLMVDCMFSEIGFEINNMTTDGSVFMRYLSGKSMTSADASVFFGNFQARFLTEVMPSISQNGQIPVAFIAYSALGHETTIQLSLDGEPYVKYITPTFCDALMAPVFTNNLDAFRSVVDGMDTVIEQCTPSIMPAHLGGILHQV